MSVVQHIRDRAGRFRWMGLLVVWAVFIVLAAVLLIERAGVQYSAGQHKLGMLAANDAVPASSAIFGQKPTCLVITDSDQAGVEDVKEQFDQILLDMKIAHRDVDLALDGADAIPSLTSFDRVILLMPSLDGLGTHLSDIMSWVSAGGSLMLAMPPDNSSYLQVIASKLGIESAGYDYVKAESIVPSEDFMLGGGERYELSDPFDSSLSVSLRETARVWAMTGDAGAPLIWSNDCGSGRTVICNIGIYDKVMRGFYAAAISLLGDATAYPVINSAVFYLDDFPSPVPSGDGTYIKRDYGLSIADFYTKVWWPDLQKLAQKYGIRYTGVMIEKLRGRGQPDRARATGRYHAVPLFWRHAAADGRRAGLSRLQPSAACALGHRLWYVVRLQNLEEQRDARRFAQRTYRVSGRGPAQRARLGLRTAVEYPFGPSAQAYRYRRSSY